MKLMIKLLKHEIDMKLKIYIMNFKVADLSTNSIIWVIRRIVRDMFCVGLF